VSGVDRQRPICFLAVPGMDLRRKRVLVTGADGFTGSHLAELLVREGGHVRASLRLDLRRYASMLPTSVGDWAVPLQTWDLMEIYARLTRPSSSSPCAAS
jgi:NAD-dependent epimerase/dehydratase family protein